MQVMETNQQVMKKTSGVLTSTLKGMGLPKPLILQNSGSINVALKPGLLNLESKISSSQTRGMLPYKNLLSNMLAGKNFGGFSMPLPTEQMHHLYYMQARKS